ncbi:uncharacterized protein LOC124249849 isoform X1 [Equus quagga]|uniref:uncharacterized protein LOC124249849 isoform X1 n=2 Tax=Equus quagga TaxID=89248 RepID=UPI001EE1AAB7|nr:uncharacterized protein LOC124249849 isoform X1 [Equus quagga]
MTPPTQPRAPTATRTVIFPSPAPTDSSLPPRLPIKHAFSPDSALWICRSFCAKAQAPPWPRQGAPPPLGKGRGRRRWAGAGAGVAWTGAGSPGTHWLPPPNTRAPPISPDISRSRFQLLQPRLHSLGVQPPLLRPAWRPRPRPPQRDPRLESSSPGRKDAGTGSYGNRVAGPAQQCSSGT